MKIEIPESIREVLRCVECNELLSCGPVFLVHETSAAICGRCSHQPLEPNPSSSKPESQNRSRNLQYEATAKLLVFPCAYSNQGCPAKLEFSVEGPDEHEQNCRFRNFFCPIVPRDSCTWVGSRQKLFEHCRDVHPAHFLQNSGVLTQPDLTVSNLSNFLVSAYKFLFLVHLKICLESGKFFHSVRMFGDPKFLDRFTYSLEIEGNNKKFTLNGSVLPARILSLQETTANSTTIKNVVKFLGGKYEDSKFTITIEALTEICKICLRKIEEVTDSNICGECSRKFIKCELSRKGCSFIDTKYKKCGKHEFYFCKYQSKCFRCEVNFNNNTFIDHLCSGSTCSETIKTNIGSVARLKPIYNNNVKFILFSGHDIGTIICSYDLSNYNLYLRVFTPLPWFELKDYKCSIELTDPETKHTSIFMPAMKDRTCDDWFIDEKMNNFPSSYNIGIDMKISINKI